MICKVDNIYKDVGKHFRSYSFSTIKLIEKYLEEIKEEEDSKREIGESKLNTSHDSNSIANSQKVDEDGQRKKIKKFFQKKLVNHEKDKDLIKEDEQISERVPESSDKEVDLMKDKDGENKK